MVSSVTSEFCLRLNGTAKYYDLDENFDKKQLHGRVWIHLDEDNPESVKWLKEESDLSELVVENLLDEDTLPRYFTLPSGTFVVLRDMNLNRHADVEDMIAIRIWIGKTHIISLSHRRQPAVEKFVADLIASKEEMTPMGVFVRLSERITENIVRVLLKIDDELDDFEDEVIDVDRREADDLRSRISDIRHQILGMRRYVAPQKEVFMDMRILEDLTKDEKAIFRSIRRDMQQAVNSLEYAREHSSVSQEDLDSRINVQLNKTMYVLTIIMVVLSPLTLITGILGSNTIEFHENPLNFLYISLSIIILGILQVWYFKSRKWL